MTEKPKGSPEVQLVIGTQEEPLFDAAGNLTPAGEEVAAKQGWRVQEKGTPGGGITGYLKE